ncbi:AP-4 complex accessory subunit tepsin isoform X1 [Phyllostomus discolor]|uniref:AP-4 complex accessory subunit tepsin isoform X1 n=1 Tax=Phyllostomus discolor TaxID=89673 RepID=A0A7E6EFF5_9CHIR|nr:AP-4 complex accessory subunit tepsin isoform X1 [Phyllostomus discolor]
MAATPLLRDRLNFLHRLPVLLKGTSDDDAPCPGYLFEEIASILPVYPRRPWAPMLGTRGSLRGYPGVGGSEGHMPDDVGPRAPRKPRLPKPRPGLGGLPEGVGEGRPRPAAPSLTRAPPRNLPRVPGQQPVPAGVPPEPSARRLWAREAEGAEDLAAPVRSWLPLLPAHPEAQPRLHPGGLSVHGAPGPTPREQLVPEGAGGRPGMGAQSRPLSALQGFGYSQDQGRAGSAGEAFLSTIQKAAEVVASAVRPGPEGPGTQGPPPRGDAYQPAVPPSASHGQLTPGNALPGARAVRHRPGQAGGGWDEQGGGPGSQSSSQESGRSKASDSGSRSGSDSPSGASRAPSDLAERVEAAALSDCQQELRLVQTVTQGPRDFLSQEEAQHFVKECGLLNCEAVLELLTRRLAGTSEHVQMRALSAIASLGRTDLLPQEHILLLARPRLQELSSGCPGPVTNKAVKILRHLEASCRQHRPAQRPLLEPGPAAACVGPSDLLADTVPFSGGQAFLQPLTSALLSPKGPTAPPLLAECPLPALGDTLEVETRLAGSEPQGAGSERGPAGADTPHGAPELGPGPGGGLWSPVARDSPGSLFAGMELVARPCLAEAGPAEEEPACAPWTLAPRAAAQEQPGSEPSAFAFLNS